MTNFLDGVHTRTWLALQRRRLRRRDLIYAARGYRHLRQRVSGLGTQLVFRAGLGSPRATASQYVRVCAYTVFGGHHAKTVAVKNQPQRQVAFAGSIDATPRHYDDVVISYTSGEKKKNADGILISGGKKKKTPDQRNHLIHPKSTRSYFFFFFRVLSLYIGTTRHDNNNHDNMCALYPNTGLATIPELNVYADVPGGRSGLRRISFRPHTITILVRRSPYSSTYAYDAQGTRVQIPTRIFSLRNPDDSDVLLITDRLFFSRRVRWH